MASQTIRVTGYREVARAARRAGKATNTVFRTAMKEVAEPIRDEATSRFSLIDARSAAGYRVAVRQRGVAVEQRIGKKTGKRGDYGALQMRRALLPALASNEDNIVQGLDKALDKIADTFEGGV
jgi:predicted Zn-dependent protease with MMP-like domain